MTPRAQRALRGLLAAATATSIALIGHLLGGGQMPQLIGVAVPLVAATLASIAVIGRRLSLWRVSTAVIASQLIFHTLFVLGTVGSATDTSAMDAMPGMAHTPATGSVLVSAGSIAAPAMGLGHIAAALFTIVLLWRGEATLRALAQLARRALARIQSLSPLPVLVPVSRFVSTTGSAPALRLVATSAWRRGPPALI